MQHTDDTTTQNTDELRLAQLLGTRAKLRSPEMDREIARLRKRLERARKAAEVAIAQQQAQEEEQQLDAGAELALRAVMAVHVAGYKAYQHARSNVATATTAEDRARWQAVQATHQPAYTSYKRAYRRVLALRKAA